MIVSNRVPLNYIFKKIRTDLVFILLVGLLFNYLSTVFAGWIPEMPLSVPTFLGTAISILLSFKMSQSYDRWWEARKVWGAIVNDSRSLVLQLQNFVSEESTNLVKKIAFRQIAWCYSLGQSLRGLNPTENLEQFIDAEDREELTKHKNKPLGILHLNTLALRKLKNENKLDSFSHVQLDSTLVRLCDAMGKAERINTTVFPLTYRLFLHFAIYLFVIVLSIALTNVHPIFEIPLLVLISAVFLLLEKTAFHLQDPFRNRPSDIPVTTIARNIEINIKQLLKEKEIPEAIPATSFYIL